MAFLFKGFPTKNLNYWRTYFWTQLVPHAVMREFRNSLPANNVGRSLRKFFYPPALRPHYDWFDFNFDENHLFFLKETYYTENHEVKCSWADLALKFKQHFPEATLDGDLYDGIALMLLINDYFQIKP